jgi:hypothetical protein
VPVRTQQKAYAYVSGRSLVGAVAEGKSQPGLLHFQENSPIASDWMIGSAAAGKQSDKSGRNPPAFVGDAKVKVMVHEVALSC